ncbi:MAG: type II toxin-antitoxin system VapB family antitoxin [Deltaproteobacteria bacterium]|nr:type II toxin-antitoxin system VapB family antitoxin [Deltaproteobacteria bacterium]
MGRTNVVLDDRLVSRAMKITGSRSKRALIDLALRRLVAQADLYRALLALKGRAPWVGDLDAWRRGRE